MTSVSVNRAWFVIHSPFTNSRGESQYMLNMINTQTIEESLLHSVRAWFISTTAIQPYYSTSCSSFHSQMFLLTACLFTLKHTIFHTLGADRILLSEHSPLVCTQRLAIPLYFSSPNNYTVYSNMY